MTPPAHDLRKFGPYVLLQLTGAGGMGRVDVAFSPGAGGSERVLKRMHQGMRSPEHVARFRREASIARGLSHEAIARTLDVEEIDGELCILQEFIQGANLAQLERRAATREPLPISLSLHVFKQVARALAYAHTRGIVHRDVAPDNIMLSYAGEVKLIDFGIAKPVGDKSLTQAGLVVGRPIYTAPEVVVGGEATSCSDVYSLGVVLWQLLTGRSFPDPFEHGPAPAPALANSLVPSALDMLCMKAIAPEVEERYQTADELLGATAALGAPDLPGEFLVSKFLARHFNVQDDRHRIATDIAAARKLIGQVTPSSGRQRFRRPAAEREPPPRKRTPFVWTTVWTTLLVFAVVVGGATIWTASRHQLRRQRTDGDAPADPRQDPSQAPEQDPVLEAKQFLRNGSFDRALSAAQRAARADGDAPEAHLVMGKVFLARQDFSRAAAHFREALRLRPDDPEPKRYLELLRQAAGTRGN